MTSVRASCTAAGPTTSTTAADFLDTTAPITTTSTVSLQTSTALRLKTPSLFSALTPRQQAADSFYYGFTDELPVPQRRRRVDAVAGLNGALAEPSFGDLCAARPDPRATNLANRPPGRTASRFACTEAQCAADFCYSPEGWADAPASSKIRITYRRRNGLAGTLGTTPLPPV